MFILQDTTSKDEEILNKVQFYIFEANDVVSNQIDHFRGSQIRRPTVFD